MARQVQNEKARDHRIVDIHEPGSNSRHDQRTREPVARTGMRFGLVLFRHARENRKTGERRAHLEHRGALERPQPRAHYRPRGNATPDSTAEISQRLPAALNAGELHRPSSRAGVETSFAEALKDSAEIRAKNPQRQK